MIGAGNGFGTIARALAGASMLYDPFDIPVLPAVSYSHGRAPRRATYAPPGFVPPRTNGLREVARRARQIQNGQLKVST